VPGRARGMGGIGNHRRGNHRRGNGRGGNGRRCRGLCRVGRGREEGGRGRGCGVGRCRRGGWGTGRRDIGQRRVGFIRGRRGGWGRGGWGRGGWGRTGKGLRGSAAGGRERRVGRGSGGVAGRLSVDVGRGAISGAVHGGNRCDGRHARGAATSDSGAQALWVVGNDGGTCWGNPIAGSPRGSGRRRNRTCGPTRGTGGSWWRNPPHSLPHGRGGDEAVRHRSAGTRARQSPAPAVNGGRGECWLADGVVISCGPTAGGRVRGRAVTGGPAVKAAVGNGDGT